FIGAVGGLAKWLTSNYVMVLGFCSILALLLFLRLAVSRSTNQKVLDQMADTSQRQIDALHRELWRLETQGDLLKRRKECDTFGNRGCTLYVTRAHCCF
ncbi:unnamed protein product, partial [Polarella glacialis]